MAAHICPVCNGRGEVWKGFYGQQHASGYSALNYYDREPCRSCEGTGVVFDRPPKPAQPKPQVDVFPI